EMVPFCCNFSWLCLLCNRNGKKMKKISYLLLFFAIAVGACAGGNAQKNNENTQTDTVLQDVPIRTGADQLEAYLPLLKGKKVGLMGNQTSIVGEDKEHLVDVLLRENIDLKFAFAPEHGFRGDIERGEKVDNTVDEKTGLTLHSLYGKNAKADSIVGSVDVMLFDLQDVG